MKQLVMVLSRREEPEWREFWERQGWRVVISQPIPKGGTASDVKARFNERLQA
jgi:hypothetical protein